MANLGKRLGRKEFCGSSTWEGEGTGGVKQETFLSAYSTLCVLLQMDFCPCALGWRLIHLVFLFILLEEAVQSIIYRGALFSWLTCQT